MADFVILELDINDGEHFYIRREKAGQSTIGAKSGYPSEKVVEHFRYHRDRKIKSGKNPTEMDQIGAEATSITVTVLQTLSDCDEGEADIEKRKIVEEYTRRHGTKVVNTL